MHADVRAGRNIWRTCTAGDGTGGRTVLEENDEILRRVERKVLDPHAEVVHDQSFLARHATRQPRCHQPTRRTEFLQGFGEQAPH